MAFGRARRRTHHVEIHFAQPMSPHVRHGHEDGIATQLMPQLGASARVVGGGTALSPDGEPASADIVMEVETDDIDGVVGQLCQVVDANGASRGSWIAVDGTKTPVGSDEYVLLRVRRDVAEQELVDLVTALQAALGDGRIAWHDETFARKDGPVFVFSGTSADDILAVLRTEIPRHDALASAELVSVTPSA